MKRTWTWLVPNMSVASWTLAAIFVSVWPIILVLKVQPMKKILALVVVLGTSLFAQEPHLYGPVTALAKFTALQGSTAGGTDVMHYGAKCDNSTDDTDAIQSAINATIPNALPLVFPSGRHCIVSQLNFTNWANRIHIYGQSGQNTGGTVIHCKESSNNEGVCLDFTGSQYVTIANLRVEADTVSPKALIRFGKSTGKGGGNSNGNSQLIYTENLATQQMHGDYSVYNNGGEVWTSVADNYNHGNVATIAFSSSASPTVTSPFATLTGSVASMTDVQFLGTTIAGSGPQVVLLDYGKGGSIGSITFLGGFGAHVSGKPWMSDTGTGATKNLTMIGFRDEPQSSNPYPLISVSQVIYNVHINGEYSAASKSSQPMLIFGTVGEGIVNMVPGDNSLNYPASIINCRLGFGLMVWSYGLKNSCPGILEVAYQNATAGTILNVNMLQSLGTAATLSGTGACATITTQLGGPWSGQATCTGPTGPSTFIVTPGYIAKNGWYCSATDVTSHTTGAMSTNSATACTLTFTTVKPNDVIAFSANAY